MAKILAFANQKGGVGKTTTCVNLCAALTQKGLRVLLVDCDPQGNATSGMGVKKNRSPNIYDMLIHDVPSERCVVTTSFGDVIPSGRDFAAATVELISRPGRERILYTALQRLYTEYDYIFLDCPPSLELITVNALAAADSVLIPMQCEYYALEGITDLIASIRLCSSRLNKRLKIEGILLTMYDGRANLTLQVENELRRYMPDKVYQTVIPRSVRLSEAPSHGLPGVVYDKNNKGSRAYLALAALFGPDLQTEPDEIRTLPLSQVEPRQDQPRESFDEERLQDLAASISRHGLIQPVIVRRLEDGYYQIIAGERRWRAARMAGLLEIPVRVLQADDRSVSELALVENLQREDLNPMEEARGYQKLIDDYGLTQEDAAAGVGKSRSAVANALRLLNLCKPVAELVENGTLSAGHARALLSLEDPALQEKAAQEVLNKSLSVRKTELLAAKWKKEAAAPPEEPKDISSAVDYAAVVSDELSSLYGRRVTLSDRKDRGKIEFTYDNAEDREALIEQLKALKQ